jgi:hypothetical protein
MTTDEIQLLRLFLLNVLHISGAKGMSERLLAQEARFQCSPAVTDLQLRLELRALGDCGWALSFNPALGDLRWRATAAGSSVLAELELA